MIQERFIADSAWRQSTSSLKLSNSFSGSRTKESTLDFGVRHADAMLRKRTVQSGNILAQHADTEWLVRHGSSAIR